jgi:hypothetical protein
LVLANVDFDDALPEQSQTESKILQEVTLIRRNDQQAKRHHQQEE